jgi:transcriptional regulator with XRE-family HTH domain
MISPLPPPNDPGRLLPRPATSPWHAVVERHRACPVTGTEAAECDDVQIWRAGGRDSLSRPSRCAAGALRPGWGSERDRIAERGGIVGYSPTVRGRRLVREVERLRHERGLSMEAAAERLGWSASKLYRLENGKSRITTDDLADMLDVYGVWSPERDALLQLCRDARRRGWWTAYSDVFTGSYISMEAEASSIRIHAHVLVPGIFQLPAYAREVIAATEPGIRPEDAERRLAARLARQEALFGRAQVPGVHAIMDEAILRRRVGGAAVTAAQLGALAEAAARPQVTIQVLPFAAGANAGMDGKFTLLGFPDDPPVAYVEGLMGDVYLEAAEETDRFHAAWARLVSQALAPGESVQMIRQLAKEHQ